MLPAAGQDNLPQPRGSHRSTMTLGPGAARPSVATIVTVVLVVAGTVSRLIEPPSFGDFDETIYAQTILLWLRGVAPYQENFYSQGPLFLLLIAPFAFLPGPPLEMMQLGVTFWSSLGLMASAMLGYRLAGGWGAATSAAVTGASPLLTHVDSHVLAEGPAVALAALSLLVGWAYRANTARPALAGLLFGGSLAAKALMPATAVPLLGGLLRSRLSVRRRFIAAVVLGLGVLLAIGATVLPFEPKALWDQTLLYRLDARTTTSDAPGAFVAEIRLGLRDDLGSLSAALIGTIVLLRASRGTALLLIAWLVVSVVLLALHHPLFPRHSAALIPPLALLAAGAGLVTGSRGISRATPNLPVLAICLAVGLSVTGHVRRWSDREPIGEVAEAATALAAATTADEYVLTDMPAIALMADRLIVPDLVDLSGVRINTGRVTTQSVAIQTERYRPGAVLFWLNRLDSGPLEAYPETVREHYTPVWQNRPWQSLWIREDATTLDSTGIPDLQALEASSFEGLVSARAVSHAGQVRSGEVWRLRVLWQLLGNPASVDVAQLELVSSDDMVMASAVLPFSPDKPMARWPSGARRMVQYEIVVPAGLQATRATPRVQLLNSNGSALDVRSDGQRPGDTWLELPRIQIVRGSSGR
jgi:hypothetical protein